MRYKKSKRKIAPVVIDTYGLFDRKGYPNSDWRNIGYQNNYTPMNMDDIYFLTELKIHAIKLTYSTMIFL